MKTPIALFLVLGNLALGLAGTPDAYMGDWLGQLTLANGASQNVAVQMIPHGEGNYEAKILSTFNRRVPTLYQLRGRLQGDRGVFIDAIPFEVGRVLGTTDDGVVVQASLWSGSLATGGLQGQIAGVADGAFAWKQTRRLSPRLGAKPPVGGVVLFDGETLDSWLPRDTNKTRPEFKLIDDGSMEVHGGDIMTREKFRDHQLHLEFQLPYMPHARGQGRANSGVYLIGRYEVQVLDSYGLEGEDNECGGIYQIAKPLVNMCAPPLQWQSYDMTFYAARFENGKKTAKARVTVILNGVTIQDNVELPGVTGGALDDNESAPGSLMLQDHGNPVRFRNIWAKPL